MDSDTGPDVPAEVEIVSVNETSGLKVHSKYERMIPDLCGLPASW